MYKKKHAYQDWTGSFIDDQLTHSEEHLASVQKSRVQIPVRPLRFLLPCYTYVQHSKIVPAETVLGISIFVHV